MLLFRTLALAGLACLAACLTTRPLENAMEASDDLHSVLDDFHAAAAEADFDRYFGHFADGAVFVGTDASEHWDVDEFRAYAAPHFEGDSAWTYVPQRRRLHLDGRGWCSFEEELAHAKYGAMRGTGILVREDGHWRISQYVLSFPIPNEHAAEVVALIAGD